MDICPYCRNVYLEWNHEVKKLACPNYGKGCDFVDRRSSNSSTLDPLYDRRSSAGSATAWDEVARYGH